MGGTWPWSSLKQPENRDRISGSRSLSLESKDNRLKSSGRHQKRSPVKRTGHTFTHCGAI
jgi:hypothetical protein